VLGVVLQPNGGQFPKVGESAAVTDNGFTLLVIQLGPFSDGLNGRGLGAGLPGAVNGVFDGVLDFFAADMAATGGNLGFEQAHNLGGGQVGVKLAGDSIKPSVNALTGTRGRAEEVVKEWREFAGHGRGAAVVLAASAV
jgi:hypothetical protein